MTKNFSASNPNFLASILIFLLSVGTGLGIKFGGSPDVVSGEITSAFGTGSLIAIISIMGISVIMPIYNWVKTKPKVSFFQVIGSPNNWVYFGTFLFSLAMLIGIEIPAGTSEAIVAAIVDKNWEQLFAVGFTNILNPLIRWWRDRKQDAELAAVRISNYQDRQ